MSTETHAIVIRIMGREIKIQCPQDKIQELQESAGYLEKKIGDLGSGNQAFSLEKLMIVTSLNVVRELMALKRHDKTHLHALTGRLRDLKSKIEQEVVSC